MLHVRCTPVRLFAPEKDQRWVNCSRRGLFSGFPFAGFSFFMSNQRKVLDFAILVLDFSGFQTVLNEQSMKSINSLLGLDDFKCSPVDLTSNGRIHMFQNDMTTYHLHHLI